MTENEVVRLERVSMKYQSASEETVAVGDVSFTVSDGEFLSIVGPSGCGKSTLLSMISGLIKPTGGKLYLLGQEVSAPGKTGYMLQNDHLFEWLTIMDNVTLGLKLQKKYTPQNTEYARELMKTYGLYGFRDRYPRELSGGMRQRAALIRTLAVRPAILLLDEAFSGLDYQTRLAVSNDIYGIIKREKKTVIMVTHDISECVGMSDRVIVLTSRPAYVKSTHKLGFRDGISPLERRETPEFKEYFNLIWKELDVHVKA